MVIPYTRQCITDNPITFPLDKCKELLRGPHFHFPSSGYSYPLRLYITWGAALFSILGCLPVSFTVTPKVLPRPPALTPSTLSLAYSAPAPLAILLLLTPKASGPLHVCFLWNLLPAQLCVACSLTSLMALLKCHLLRKALSAALPETLPITLY